MSAIADRLRALLARIHQQQQLAHTSGDVKVRLAALRAWQARRLAVSYADIRNRQPFAAACEFFLNDLYGEGDFADRDRAVERVVPIMMRMLPEPVLSSLARAIELNALSQELDFAMAKALPARCVSAEQISDEDYAAAYIAATGLSTFAAPVNPRTLHSLSRSCRREQLALLLILGRELDRLVRKPLLNELLRMCRWPARLAGLGALQSFLERGFAAFGKLGGAGKFLGTIVARERQFMRAIDRIEAGDAQVHLQDPNSWSR